MAITTTGTTRANGASLDVRHVGVDESSEIRSSSIQLGEQERDEDKRIRNGEREKARRRYMMLSAGDVKGRGWQLNNNSHLTNSVN